MADTESLTAGVGHFTGKMKKREYTGNKRWVYHGKKKTLQSEVKHWHENNPTKVLYTWEDIRTVKIGARDEV